MVSPLVLASVALLLGSDPPRATAPEPDAAVESTAVPAPSSLRARVRVDGRTSLLEALDIVDVGQTIPATYSDGKIGNTDGFRWWVSRHFALKSDLPDADARLYLELVELAWPHYVEAFGGAPPDPRRRIALVYGSNWEKLRRAMLCDGFRRGAHAGGETMFFNRVAYSFPTQSPDHRRYIVVHEAAHAFQMARTGYSGWAPTWFVEGIADAVAHHVFDEDRRSMTVFVFDRAPQSWLQKGLARYAKGKPSIASINANPTLERELNFLLVHFLRADPVRAASLAAWRDALALARLEMPARVERSEAWLTTLLGPDAEEQFAAWVHAQRPTLEAEPWTWEQDGDALWFRNRKGTTGRIEVNVTLDNTDATAPLRLDYPHDLAAQARVGLPDAGAAAGFEVDFAVGELDRGRVGWGLGRDPSGQLATLWLERADVIEFDARSLDGPRSRLPLPDPVREALRAAGAPRASVRMVLLDDALQVTLQAFDGEASAGEPWSHAFPLHPSVVDAVRRGEMAMLAENASHPMRPVLRIGPGRHPAHPAHRDLTQLAYARLMLGDQAPPSVATMQAQWVQRRTGPIERRLDRWRLATSLAASHPWAAAVVAGFGPPAPRYSWGGVTLNAEVRPSETGTTVDVTVTGPLSGETKGVLWLDVLPGASEPDRVAFEVAPFEATTKTLRVPSADDLPLRIDAWAELEADGEPLVLRTTAERQHSP